MTVQPNTIEADVLLTLYAGCEELAIPTGPIGDAISRLKRKGLCTGRPGTAKTITQAGIDAIERLTPELTRKP